MELKKRRWQCRYMREYLAVGEAPEQVRNCFQQKSRWCKVTICRCLCLHSISGNEQLATAAASMRLLSADNSFICVPVL